jgi:hypothetical protein
MLRLPHKKIARHEAGYQNEIQKRHNTGSEIEREQEHGLCPARRSYDRSRYPQPDTAEITAPPGWRKA